MLFFDNFSSLLGILGAMVGTPLIACNFDPSYGAYYGAYTDMVFRKVCPGIGCALIFGNVWYAWMAAKLAAKEDRMDVTALPYGINTPAGFITVFAVMLPVAASLARDPSWSRPHPAHPRRLRLELLHGGVLGQLLRRHLRDSGHRDRQVRPQVLAARGSLRPHLRRRLCLARL